MQYLLNTSLVTEDSLRRRITLRDYLRTRGFDHEYVESQVLDTRFGLGPSCLWLNIQRCVEQIRSLTEDGDELWEWAHYRDGKLFVLGLAIVRSQHPVHAWTADYINLDLPDCSACDGIGLSPYDSRVVCLLCDGFGKQAPERPEK